MVLDVQPLQPGFPSRQGQMGLRLLGEREEADRVLLDYLVDVNAPAIVRHARPLLPGGAILLRAV
jgi:hypothetical protein